MAKRYSLSIIAIILAILGAVLITYGFNTMYTYGDGTIDQTGHIVGGDAYNFIIIAVRGLGWIIAGVGSGVSSAIFVVGAFTVRIAVSKPNIVVAEE